MAITPRIAAAALGCSLLFLSTASAATTVTANLGGVGVGLKPGINATDGNAISVTFNNHGVDSGPAYIGQINWTGTVVSPTNFDHNAELMTALNGGDSFSTYCIEGLENVYFGNQAHWDGVTDLTNAPNPSPVLSTVQIANLTRFWNNNFDSLASLNTTTANDNAAAFQIGIWEIVSQDNVAGIGADNTANAGNFLGTGNFQAYAGDATTMALATIWLSQLASGIDTHSGEYSIYALTAAGVQDQIFAVANPKGSIQSVPLPAALPAGLSLVGVLALLNFRRRRAI